MKKKQTASTTPDGLSLDGQNFDALAESNDYEDLSQDILADDQTAPIINQNIMANEGSAMTQTTGGEFNTYTVQKGDTLMLIAYKVYGDYSKWRDLADLNNATNLSIGSTIQYRASMENFPVRPEGNPYLIKNGDSLGGISDMNYGTTKHWRAIYQNNRQMIKNPNLIFAGFTLYLPNLSNEVASNYIEL
jgi:nucleoid-associated protein YgaU